MTESPEAAIAADEIGEFGAAHRREVFAERGHAEVRTDFVEPVNDFVAEFAGRSHDRSAQ